MFSRRASALDTPVNKVTSTLYSGYCGNVVMSDSVSCVMATMLESLALGGVKFCLDKMKS